MNLFEDYQDDGSGGLTVSSPSIPLIQDVNISENGTQQICTNEYCISDAEYIGMIEEYIFPTPYEWILIAMHITVFVVGLVGNSLVCISVYRNHAMRTVTNYFIVNLAVADFLVIFICLPPSVLWDVTETWFFGSVMCKLVLYLQSVSVSVSVLTLTFISVDRWYAICYPLRFKSTASRAKKAIAFIWMFSTLFSLPDAIVLDTIAKKDLQIETLYLTDCAYTWDDQQTKYYQLVIVVLLYVAPFAFMLGAYCQIVRVLWNKEIPGASETSSSNALSTRRNSTMKHAGRNGAIRFQSSPNAACEGQIRSRRKAAKMLMAVVVIFALCYLPVHLINTLRYVTWIPQTHATTVASLISHWLCYANSAINPVIYNFMSGKFRREFRNAFCMLCTFCNRRRNRSTPANSNLATPGTFKTSLKA